MPSSCCTCDHGRSFSKINRSMYRSWVNSSKRRMEAKNKEPKKTCQLWRCAAKFFFRCWPVRADIKNSCHGSIIQWYSIYIYIYIYCIYTYFTHSVLKLQNHNDYKSYARLKALFPCWFLLLGLHQPNLPHQPKHNPTAVGQNSRILVSPRTDNQDRITQHVNFFQ